MRTGTLFRRSTTHSGEYWRVLRVVETRADATTCWRSVKHRRRTSPAQLKVLEYHFDRNPKPDVTLRKALSEQLEMTPREVQVWVRFPASPFPVFFCADAVSVLSSSKTVEQR